MDKELTQDQIDFDRIAKAIYYIQKNFKQQPGLDEVARYVHLSPFHFQRMFQDWAGISPKKFLQYLNINYAKQILKNNQTTLFDTAYQTGLSGTGRLHDLFIKIEGMTPGEYKNGGVNLRIKYSFYSSIFGKLFVASTPKGVCYIGFSDQLINPLNELRTLFPHAVYIEEEDENQHRAMGVFRDDWRSTDEIKLHLKGTDFQLKVWEALLKIPLGELTTYGGIAKEIRHPKACRAVGSAVGDNPVSILIPCHRVIQSSGALGQYHWGADRKTALVAWEAAFIERQNSKKQ